MDLPLSYAPDPRILELDDGFHDVVEAVTFPEHRLRYRNQAWAERVGLGGLGAEDWEACFAGFRPLPGNLERPLALRYHGHQFRSYNPNLGDGRGFLYAQLRDPVDGRLLDLGTKGSGKTPYSRGGDGRLTLKGAVREVLATEMLEALGVNTSKTFSVFETGESLVRYDEPSPTRAAVLVRLSHSHLRFGSFQVHHYKQDSMRVRKLMGYAVRHFFPDLSEARPAALPGLFLRAVSRRAARFAAELMAAGFVHGVLNTDNLNVTGESFDYGPYRFLPELDPGFTAAYFDRGGLYAYGRQAEAVRWNLEQLARALGDACPVLCDRVSLGGALGEFSQDYQAARRDLLFERLGLRPRGDDVDREFVARMEAFLQRRTVGFPRFFFDWFGGRRSQDRARGGAAGEAYQGPEFSRWAELLGEFDDAAGARLDDPYFARQAPCDMLIDEVEAVWDPIARADDWSRFEAKLAEVRAMGAAYGRGLVPAAPETPRGGGEAGADMALA